MMKTREANGGFPVRQNVSWKSGWREIGEGKRYFFRSKWEMNYARFLQFLKDKGEIADWLYEPKTFWFEAIKRGTCSYKPDFQIILKDGTHYWDEVKGWMDDRSKTKLRRMKKYYPHETVNIIDATWFKKNKLLSGVIEGWEK